MALQTVYFKEHEDHNPSIGKLSAAVSAAPWWSSLVSQSLSGEACGQLKTLSFENLIANADVTSTKQPGRIGQDIYKDYGDGQKVPAISLHSPLPEYRALFEIGFSHPLICAKYPYVDQGYGVLQTYGPQTTGRIMLPSSLSTDNGPIYVNPKQYNGILRRRKSRTKAAMINRLTRARKPYMHESRHLHAMRRPRGCGGRFLNLKIDPKKGAEPKKKGTKETKISSTGSQGPEVLQSNSGSKEEADGRCHSNILSELTSMYSNKGGDLNLFQINNFRPSLLSFSDIMDSGHGLHVMPNNWVGVANSCGKFRT